MNLHWTKLTGLYPDKQQCLASFIAWQAAEVIAEAKPSNLINILDRRLPCGRNIMPLWNTYHTQVLEHTELSALELKQNKRRKLVLIYHSALLEQVLELKCVKNTLESLGYDYADANGALAQLKLRMWETDFPHEIGFFLGYPVKDVMAFMGLVKLPYVFNGPWKMYGHVERSLKTHETHVRARKRILDELAILNPLQVIQSKAA